MNRDNITCGLCFKLLSKPVTLSCGHDFCEECVKARLMRNNDNGILCPLCATPHIDIRLNNLNEYINSELEAYILTLAGGRYGGPVCQWCEEVTAEVQCMQCASVYCAACSTAVHKNHTKRTHVTGPITDAFKTFHRRCNRPSHDAYKAEFYCTDCEELCCAYCLQVGPHRHHNSAPVYSAAEQMRQQMPKDIEMLTQNRQRLETQANELHRVSKQYTDTYDSVENIISERFAAFKQQLVQRELEARNALSALRDAGDVTLTTTRKAFLSRLNDVNVGLLRFRTLENNGADYEVLENRSKIHACANAEVPSIMGRGFQLTNIGDLVLTGLEVTLDLNSSDNRMESPAAKGRQPVANNNLQVAIQKSAPPPVPLRLTFPVDDNVQASVGEDGVFLRCVAKHGNGVQIGVRSRETLSSIINRYPRDNGNVSWQVRLENIKDTFWGWWRRRAIVPSYPMDSIGNPPVAASPTATLGALPLKRIACRFVRMGTWCGFYTMTCRSLFRSQ
ncbi:zinc-finger protein, conserved [Angomonas deanei]|nr:zinc-finger protein, conserved [Angomonas deanei]|eukprot:EPY29707.1 zinc-finger protein, conserved [Angomonas deanei]